MKKIIFLFISLTTVVSLTGQNLCPDGSFESDYWWNTDNQFQFLVFDTNWDLMDEVSIFDYFSNASLGLFNNTNIYLSAPDNYFGSQQAYHGNKYGALWGYNMVDYTAGNREVFINKQLSAPLNTSLNYVIQFMISKMDNSTKDPRYKVILSTGVNELGEPNGHEKTIYKGTCSNSTDWETVHIELDDIDYEYEYISIKCYENNTPLPQNWLAGFYIDKVVVMEKCDFDGYNCYSISGPFNPVYNNNPTANGAGFNISNLDNATRARMIISPLGVNGQQYWDITVHSCSGITNPFYWVGGLFNGSGISPASAGTYDLELHLSNLCYSETYYYSIIKLDNSFAEDYQWTTYPTVCNLADLLIPGCTPYLYVSEPIFPGETYDFQAINMVRTSNEVIVHPTAELTLHAQDEIIMEEGFEAVYGSEFHAFIDNQMRSYEQSNSNQAQTKTVSIFNDSISLSGIRTFPNPVKDMFTLEFFVQTENHVLIEIFNSYGDLVENVNNTYLNAGLHQFQILTTNYQPGLYVVVVKIGDVTYQSKIIVTK